uniref:Uncharacterized protein n=1 Tax=Plectus sambesii TaxID=2011161 RepID=A0A914WTX2_9BILA
MKDQFDQNKKDKTLFVGAQVLTRIYNSKRNRWVRGIIVEQRGSVKWGVQVEGQRDIWLQHSNQLRLLNTAQLSSTDRDQDLPIDGSIIPKESAITNEKDAADDARSDNHELFRSPDKSLTDKGLEDDATSTTVTPTVTAPPMTATSTTLADAQPMQRRSTRQAKAITRFSPSRC